MPSDSSAQHRVLRKAGLPHKQCAVHNILQRCPSPWSTLAACRQTAQHSPGCCVKQGCHASSSGLGGPGADP
eukprot:scaffold143538_cov23-Tisochrysis_lutea.AAC.2